MKWLGLPNISLTMILMFSTTIINKMTGALAGYLAGGPVWGVIGAVLGGNPAVNEKHVILCELDNGWKFALELDKNEYIAWNDSVGEAVKTRQS